MSSEKVQIHHALGIDFGTSNSYFSDVRVGGSQLSYTDLKFHNGHSSVPTCILYEKKKSKKKKGNTEPEWVPHSFGEAAIELWKDLVDEERESFKFRGGFKPDIAFEPQAYQDAVSFFICIKEYLLENRLISHFSPEHGRQIVVGVPARNVSGQEKKTLEALKEAGIPDVVLIPEPEGALFYHLYYDSDRITVDKAHKGVIVIDFGGGTFDVAYLRDSLVKNHWGNPMLGGRLFDDLFFQWFLDIQGKDCKQEMKDDGTMDYLRAFGFRRLKERFSTSWQNKQLKRFRERVTVGVDFDYGVFRNATLEEFFERAKTYRASEELLRDLELLNDKSVEALRGGEVDLLALIRQQLSEKADSIDSDEIQAVVLTGGSCRWPFMFELVKEAFPKAELFQSPDPEATISRGLALSYAFREYSKEVSTGLQKDQEGLKVDIFKAVHGTYSDFARRVAERFTSELYTARIQPIFRAWREQGGSIADLEKLTEEAGKVYFEGEGKLAVEKEQLRMKENLMEVVNDCIFKWLRNHRIIRTEFLPLDLHNIKEDDLMVRSGITGIMDEFFEGLEILVTGVVGVVVASIAGGSGVALLMSGPLGLVFGFILAAAAMKVVFVNVERKKFKIPPFVLKMAATNERLQRAREDFQKESEEKLKEIFENRKGEFEEELGAKIEEMVIRIARTIPVTAIMQQEKV